MSESQPWQRCAECERLARDFQDAWRDDQQNLRARFFETVDAAGREADAFLRQWIASLARMPDDEFDRLQSAGCPRVAQVRRKWHEHETRSGHPGLRKGWRDAFILDAVLRGGYYRAR